MGLLLSVLVVCVGVLEAISCVRHVQHGYLPFWVSTRMRPMIHERLRRKPNDDDSSDESSDELSRILHNGGGVNINRAESPSYGLTPILTEHRRNTPILRDDEEATDETSRHPKYVANNIDDPYSSSSHDSLLTERFRPISPSEFEEPLDGSYVSQSGKFLELPPDGSPLQRSSSEETLHDSEPEDILSLRALAAAACAVDEHGLPSKRVDTLETNGGTPKSNQVAELDEVVFQIDRASPPLPRSEQREYSDNSNFHQPRQNDDNDEIKLDDDTIDDTDDDSDFRNDPVFNLVSAAAHILRNDANTMSDSEFRSRKSPHVFGTASSIRPLNIDVTARIPTPQAHRESIPFDLVAAHAHASTSRPDTPTTPRKSKADISWPVFHPEPVIKRPVIARTELTRDDSIEEGLDYLEGEIPAASSTEVTSHSTASYPTSFPGAEAMTPSPHLSNQTHLSSKIPSDLEIPFDDSSSKPRSSNLPQLDFTHPEPKCEKADAGTSTLDKVRCVEDQCSKVVIRSLSSVHATPFMTIPGTSRVCTHRNVSHDSCPRPYNTSVDKFGRITCKPHKCSTLHRRGSLEHPGVEGNLKDSVMSKSLPDFFFEENMAASLTSKPLDNAGKVTDDTSESVSLGKDITPKESSIKRRKSYREKKRSTWTPSKSRSRGSTAAATEAPAEALSEVDDESMTSLSENEATPVDAEITASLSKPEAIINRAVMPEEVLHHGEVSSEGAVFATKTQQPKTRLKKPAKAESFEEAVPSDALTKRTNVPVPLEARRDDVTHPDVANKPDNRPTSDLDENQNLNLTKANKEETPHLKSNLKPLTDSPVKTLSKSSTPAEQPPPLLTPPLLAPPATVDAPQVSEESPSLHESASKPHETKANNEEEEEEEEEDDDVYNSASESDTSNIKQPQQSSQPAPFWLIFSGEYTKAMSKDWHSGHFCCWQCDESLTGQRYVLRDDHPYCIKCYESVFANMCEECSKTIGIDSKDLSYKDKHWHEACFLCNKCRVSLVDKQFGSKADKIYCSNCYDAQFASRCDGCGEIFRAGTKKMEYKTRQWHEKCFCCCVCKSAIGTKSFIPREQEIYCATCYEEKFATRCVKCNKIITSGGVTYKNEPWHRECFTCTHCNTSLAGQRFTSRDEKPYCAECFGELFAKRCTACVKPITGIGGTRFISFEDRHWHNDCFICASCKTSLVGRGFITDAEDIICPECAKQKLM